jgi:hypothetical protein
MYFKCFPKPNPLPFGLNSWTLYHQATMSQQFHVYDKIKEHLILFYLILSYKIICNIKKHGIKLMIILLAIEEA